MPSARGNRSAVLQWVIVLGVGALVVTVVLGLNLIPRLNDGQKVLDGARPAFAAQRVAADRAGIDIISKDVDMADPIMTPEGGAAAEIPAVVAYVAKTKHISDAAALALMRKTFPHTTALLTAVPLTSVTEELPGLVAFLSKVLKVTPAQLAVALKENFPALNQAITNLPTVTAGWNDIQHIDGMTRFDGSPVKTVPLLRTYFSADLIPVLEHQRGNFNSLDGTSKVNWIAPLLLIIGLVVMAFAAVMIVLSLRGVPSRVQVAGAAVVPVVGVVVVALALGLSLVPRVSDGQKLLDALAPANTQQRVAGDRAGIAMVDAIVKTEDPIMTATGGAAAEVPKLIAFVSDQTGLSQAAVVAALQKNFPHTTGLLQAIPLSAVTDELPALTTFLAPAVGAVPHLAQVIKNAPAVTGGWDAVPGLHGATRFDGTTPIKTVGDVRTYFGSDVIPVLETQRLHYDKLVETSNIDFIGPLVLIVGIIVVVFGLLMVLLAVRPRPRRGGARRPRRRRRWRRDRRSGAAEAAALAGDGDDADQRAGVVDHRQPLAGLVDREVAGHARRRVRGDLRVGAGEARRGGVRGGRVRDRRGGDRADEAPVVDHERQLAGAAGGEVVAQLGHGGVHREARELPVHDVGRGEAVHVAQLPHGRIVADRGARATTG
jgi:hypothetical protein